MEITKGLHPEETVPIVAMIVTLIFLHAISLDTMIDITMLLPCAVMTECKTEGHQ